MRYKEDNNNRYRVNFMRATEELMDALTVESFISYLEENAEFEDYTVEYIDGKCVKCRAYDLTEENSKLHKEFLVTEDSHFTIKMSDREDERGTDTDFMVARNEHDEYMTGRIIGVDECWQDGDLNTCVAGLLRGIATIAHSRY